MATYAAGVAENQQLEGKSIAPCPYLEIMIIPSVKAERSEHAPGDPGHNPVLKLV